MRDLFKYNGRNINYTDSGKGFPVVLLHGYPETSAIFKSFSSRLGRYFRVISIDLPGHGGSQMLGAVHTMDLMADMVCKLIDKQGINRFILAGHSLGDYITLAFADLFPERLAGMCLLHSHPFADTPEVVKRRENEMKLVGEGRKDDFLRANVEKMYTTAGKQKFARALEDSVRIATGISGEAINAILRGMMERPSRLHIMEEGRIPLLWILGRMDNYINCEEILAKVRLPANARVEIMESSGHLAFIEEEEKSAEVLGEFVKGVASFN